MESAQLGVAIDPVRSITWPMFTVALFADSCLQAPQQSNASAAIRAILFISVSMRVSFGVGSCNCGSRSPERQKNSPEHACAGRPRWSLLGSGCGDQRSRGQGDQGQRDGERPRAAQPHLVVVRGGAVLTWIEVHDHPPGCGNDRYLKVGVRTQAVGRG